MEEVAETQESPHRNRRGAAVAAGALVVVIGLLAVWLGARDDPDGVEATNGGEEVAAVYRLPADVDVADVEIDPGGVVACDCELEEVGTYPLLSAEAARNAIATGHAFMLNSDATNERDVSGAVAEVGAAIWSGTNVYYVVPTWRFVVEGGDVIEVLAIDPDALFAPSPSSSTTTPTTEFENTDTTVPVVDTGDTNAPADPTATTATTAPSSAAKGVLLLHIANTTNKPVEFFFETTDGMFTTSVVVEAGEQGEANLTVPGGCVAFTISLGVGTFGATESVIVGREPIEVYAGYVPDRESPIEIGLEVPKTEIGCAP